MRIWSLQVFSIHIELSIQSSREQAKGPVREYDTKALKSIDVNLGFQRRSMTWVFLYQALRLQ
jgi:hypothetical protein